MSVSLELYYASHGLIVYPASYLGSVFDVGSVGLIPCIVEA